MKKTPCDVAKQRLFPRQVKDMPTRTSGMDSRSEAIADRKRRREEREREKVREREEKEKREEEEKREREQKEREAASAKRREERRLAKQVCTYIHTNLCITFVHVYVSVYTVLIM